MLWYNPKMDYKRSRVEDPYLFFKPLTSEKRVGGIRGFAINFALRIGAFMMCPGDDFVVLSGASSTAGQPELPPMGILYEHPLHEMKINNPHGMKKGKPDIAA